MTITVHKLAGTDIPASFRVLNVDMVWLVIADGAAIRCCTSEAEAFALMESLRENETSKDTSVFKSPRMG